MLNKPHCLRVFSAKFVLAIVAIQYAALPGCYPIDNQQALSQTLKSEKQQVIANSHLKDFRVVPDENINFQVVGTVTEISIEDISKKAGIKNFYTYITVKVEKISPESISAKLKFSELNFTRRTNANIDSQISVGNQVNITVVSNNLSTPKYFRIYDIKKISD